MKMERNWKIFDGEEVVDSGSYEVSWDRVRAERDQALADSDWRAVKDRTMSQAWKDYRQALRDLPQEHIDANDAADNWPQPPE